MTPVNPTRFKSFVILAGMRTGSNLLESLLNQIEGISCHGELFNPNFIGHREKNVFPAITLSERNHDPFLLLSSMQNNNSNLNGFRYFHNHDHRIFPAVINDPTCAKIVLTRNPVESFTSLKIAQQTDQWKLLNIKAFQTAQIYFSPEEFEKYLLSTQKFHQRIKYALQKAGQPSFGIDYSDLESEEVLQGLALFLGIKPKGKIIKPPKAPDNLKELSQTGKRIKPLKRQNPLSMREKVKNFDELEKTLASLDIFSISHTPFYEPRRDSELPSFVASKTVPLLFMPVASSTEARVISWLSSFGPTKSKFTPKSIAQWKEHNTNYRSFCVLRHPVARAHTAFMKHNLSHTLTNIEIYRQMRVVFKVDLPLFGHPYLTPQAYKKGLLTFLKWIPRNFAGQSELPTENYWASQTAILQGFSKYQSPDMVLREDRLAQGLHFLCSEIGEECPPLTDEYEGNLLAEIYDDELEQATRLAYRCDYDNFGFGNWRI